jgi:hypothetical protein
VRQQDIFTGFAPDNANVVILTNQSTTNMRGKRKLTSSSASNCNKIWIVAKW